MREFAKEIDVSFVKIEEVIGAGKSRFSHHSQMCTTVHVSILSKMVLFLSKCYLAVELN